MMFKTMMFKKGDRMFNETFLETLIFKWNILKVKRTKIFYTKILKNEKKGKNK